jgi:predicted RNA-binding Zn ribbon-like protein
MLTAPRVGDHPALDLVNTVAMVDGRLIDFLQSDADVLAWLAAQGFTVAKPAGVWPSALLATARRLRALIKAAVLDRKAAKAVRVKGLNTLLHAGAGHPVLRPNQRGHLELIRTWRGDSAEQIPGPLIESAAEFANADFDLVRVCEDEHCVLWFYDRTKSHHRRWCSVSTCGNRNKMAAFRARQKNRLT